MNRFLLNIIFSFLISTLVGQQNLVPNGSFEEYSECPTGNELNNGQFERATGWFRPTNSTPDFYHRCNNNINGTVGVPNNFWGYQEPFHGQGYIGFGAIVWNEKGESIGNEYIRTELKSPLKPCMKYHFRMYVSLAEASTHGIGSLGVLLTKENEFTSTIYALEKNPQIEYKGLPIIDTSTWTIIEGTFISKGFEKHLTIGYFSNTIGSDTAFIQDFGVGSYSGFYLDSVSLYEIGSVSEELCDAGNISFPNIVTANSDGTNELLDASSYFAITDEIVILNRWGNVIKVLTEENSVWNGTTANGKDCTEGVYFYKFDYQWGSQTKHKSGFIHLVR